MSEYNEHGFIETQTGCIMLHGRPVIVQKLDPKFHGTGYKYVVIEIGRIEDKTAWLWDGVADV